MLIGETARAMIVFKKKIIFSGHWHLGTGYSLKFAVEFKFAHLLLLVVYLQ